MVACCWNYLYCNWLLQELAFVQKGEGHSMKVMPMTLAMSSSGECSTTDEDAGINSRVDTRGRQPLVASGNLRHGADSPW